MRWSCAASLGTCGIRSGKILMHLCFPACFPHSILPLLNQQQCRACADVAVFIHGRRKLGRCEHHIRCASFFCFSHFYYAPSLPASFYSIPLADLFSVIVMFQETGKAVPISTNSDYFAKGRDQDMLTAEYFVLPKTTPVNMVGHNRVQDIFKNIVELSLCEWNVSQEFLIYNSISVDMMDNSF